MNLNLLQKWKLKSLKKKIAQLYHLRQNGTATDINLRKEIELHHRLAEFYAKHLFDKKFPNAEILMLESYRMAANLGDAKAQYLLSKRLIDKGRFWDELAKTIYADKIHRKYAKEAYEEGMAYLQLAVGQNYFLAMRLYGLVYINGWGVDIDRDKGFQAVVDSIEQEGAWDKATKIFEQNGLNRPEFFATMMAMRKNASSR